MLNLVPMSRGWWHQPGWLNPSPAAFWHPAKSEGFGLHQDSVNHPKELDLSWWHHRELGVGGIFTEHRPNVSGTKGKWVSREGWRRIPKGKPRESWES